MRPPRRAFLIAAGALVVWGACMLSWAAGAQAVWAPQSLAPMLLGLFVFGLLGRAAPDLALYMLALPALFVAWHLTVTARNHKIGMLALLVILEMVVMSISWLIMMHPAAVRGGGAVRAYAIDGFNLLFLVALFFAFRRNQDAPTERNSLAFDLLLFCWLGWVAFPWPGGSWFP